MSKAGMVVPIIWRMCSKIGISPIPAAKLVVSDIGDIYPKTSAAYDCACCPFKRNASRARYADQRYPIVLTVVRLEPTSVLMIIHENKAVNRRWLGSIKDKGINCHSRYGATVHPGAD